MVREVSGRRIGDFLKLGPFERREQLIELDASSARVQVALGERDDELAVVDHCPTGIDDVRYIA
jgi:hypothetical protein